MFDVIALNVTSRDVIPSCKVAAKLLECTVAMLWIVNNNMDTLPCWQRQHIDVWDPFMQIAHDVIFYFGYL